MRPGAEPWVRWTIISVCLGGALSMALGAAPSWLIPVALTVAALVALPEIVDNPRVRRLWRLAISTGCLLATWLLRPPPIPVAPERAWFTVLAGIGILLFAVLMFSFVGWLRLWSLRKLLRLRSPLFLDHSASVPRMFPPGVRLTLAHDAQTPVADYSQTPLPLLQAPSPSHFLDEAGEQDMRRDGACQQE